MISKKEFFKRNNYRRLTVLFALLCVVALVDGIYTDNPSSLWVALGLLVAGCGTQLLAEKSYKNYQASVNRNPNDDLR